MEVLLCMQLNPMPSFKSPKVANAHIEIKLKVQEQKVQVTLISVKAIFNSDFNCLDSVDLSDSALHKLSCGR